MGLIGSRCKPREGFSRGVLIDLFPPRLDRVETGDFDFD